MIDVDAHRVAVGVEVDHDARDNLARAGAGAIVELDLERVALGVVAELHSSPRLEATERS